MARLNREISRFKDQERRLVKLYQFGEVDDEWIKAQSGSLKLTREQCEVELRRLKAQQASLAELEHAEKRLRDFCDRVRRNLGGFDFAQKRTTLEALQIRATVAEDKVRIKGILGVQPVNEDLATTARTSA